MRAKITIEKARQNLYFFRGVAWFVAMALWVAAVLSPYRWLVFLAGATMLVYVLGKKPDRRRGESDWKLDNYADYVWFDGTKPDRRNDK